MKYDAIVIGSGQGGNPLAYRLADLGWTVALVEKAHLGGTCINTGCTPTKTMVASAIALSRIDPPVARLNDLLRLNGPSPSCRLYPQDDSSDVPIVGLNRP